MIFPSSSQKWAPLLLGLGLIFVTLVSVRFIQNEISPFYPLYLDQVGYLKWAYLYSDALHRDGMTSVLSAHLGHDSAALGFSPSLNSNMSLLAGILFLFLGEGRIIALTLQLSSWLLLIAVLYFVILKITRQTGYALAACGFALLLKMPHVKAGGMEDFRMDFVAACWIGISAALWILFLHRPKASYVWMAAASMIVLVTFRIISLVYLSLPLGWIAVLMTWSFLTGKRPALRRAFWPLLIFGAYSLILVFWDWSFLRGYYFETQLGSEIAARGADKTWDNIPEALSYYPLSLAKRHFGFIPLYGLLLAIALAIGLFFWDGRNRSRLTWLPIRGSAILFAIFSFVFPLVVLTSNPTRTPQVVGVSVIALALAGFLVFLRFRPRHRQSWTGYAGLALFAIGLVMWPGALATSAPFKGEARRDALNLNVFFAESFNQITTNGARSGSFALLDSEEAFHGIGFYGREHLHSTREVTCVFPVQIPRMDQASVLKVFSTADMVLLPRDPNVLHRFPHLLPIAESMIEHYPAVKADVSSRMKLQSSMSYRGVVYDVYVPLKLEQKNPGQNP